MYRKNVAGQHICVQLLLTATGAVATGLTPTARRCIDGTFAAGGGTFSEDGTTGSYKYAMAQADTNGNNISIIVTATGAIPVCINFVTTAADPTNATTFGLTNLDVAVSTADDAPLAAIAALSIPTANANADALLDRSAGIETGMTPRQALRLIAATTGAKMSGGGTTTNTFRNAVADSKDRVAATVDVNGNRSAITYDLT